MASTSLEEKINKIRQQNEEIRRRHEEVEADKQNAAKLNALVNMVPSTDWPERKEPPEFSNPAPPRSNGNHKSKVSGREHRGQQQQYHAGGGDGKKTHVFAEGDGPPPDPTYNFLADSEREERTREDSRDNEKFRGRGGPLRGGSRRRGGGREGYSKEYRGSQPGPKDSSKPEYEAWRAERNRIDEARISRQRTAEGNWRREWDNNKMNVEEDEAGPNKTVKLDIGDMVRKEHKEFDKWQNDGPDHESPRGRGGKPYVSRGASRGSHNNRAYQHSNSFEQYHGPASPPPNKPPISPNGVDERTVVATDKSIKVIVNHGSSTAKGPVMSIKVSSSSIAGTGRVGPRQKPRILYSSQSESETPCGDPDKYFSHKSADDKTNRVSFNRDIEEQQRYAVKNPHTQSKAENNSKSPYLARKEFKYDVQQQKHGEIEPKSPHHQQQRKDIKDSSKSPHFQKKADFVNRESHAKQKNNNSGNDTFKSNHSQKRNTEKVKHDLQKFSGPKKLEDNSANPKPQRINRRNDKSKNLQHANSKEPQESNTNENNTQLNKLDTSKPEESNKNGVESNSSENISDISVSIETFEGIQNENVAKSELNINSEAVNSSIVLEKHESISEDKKSTDESVVLTHVDTNQISESVIAFNNDDEKEVSIKNDETNIAAAKAVTESKQSTSGEIDEKVKDAEFNETSPEFIGGVQEKIEIAKNTDDHKDDNETKSILNDETKVEDSLTVAENSATPNEFEGMKSMDSKNDSETSETEVKVSAIPVNEEKKFEDSVVRETETQKKIEEQISENIIDKEEVIEDSKNNEKSDDSK